MSAATYGAVQRKKCIQNSDPGKILDLILRFTEGSCANLQVKTNLYLLEEAQADVVFQIIVNGELTEAFIEVVNDNILPDGKMKIAVTPKLVEILKSSNEKVDYLTNFEADVKNIVLPFYSNINNLRGRNLKDPETSFISPDKARVVMLAIADHPFSTIICVVGPKVLEENAALIIHELYLFIWPTINRAINLEYEYTLKTKCQQLLRVAKRLFTQVASLESLLQIAMEQAKILTKAQHCSVKLVDVERLEIVQPAYPEQRTLDDPTNERRFPLKTGIVGHVIQTGFLVNLRSPTKNKRFNADIDTLPGVECKTLLAFPIRDRTGIIGVGQLINTCDDTYFDSMDEEMALAFSVYCGMCIMHAVVYRRLQEANIRNKLANELIMYHMKVSDAEVTRLLECKGFHGHPQLAGLNFNPRVLPYRELPCYFIRMVRDLGLQKTYKINDEKLARYILHVKRGYRDVPYHNWSHAFNVLQWAYAACLNFKLVPREYFNELQQLMYIIAAVNHDLDHRGTTSSFQIQGQTTLGALYSSEGSVMERHHLAQAMCILNTEGCDILENLPRRDYDRALLLLKDLILATDLASYLKNYNEYKAISYDYQKGNRSHASALQAILMNCADLSDQLKDWSCVKKTAAGVVTEFFTQGDAEKHRGEVPMMIMDREKCFIPDLQINFLTGICIPLFQILGNIFPRAQPCAQILEGYVEKWETAKLVFNVVTPSAGLSLLVNPDLDRMIEQALIDKARRLEEEQEQEEEDTK